MINGLTLPFKRKRVFILKEQLRAKQKVAVFLATIRLIILLTNGVGRPEISIVLASSFGLYGLIRKKIGIPSLEGLFFEMCFCLIPVGLLLLYRFNLGRVVFFDIGHYEQFMAMLAGIVTLIPLLAFNMAVKKIPLTSIGLLQYIAPSLQFILAVFFYGENFSQTHLFAFFFIWMALIIYTTDLLQFNSRNKRGELIET